MPEEGLLRILIRFESAVTGLEEQLAIVTAERDALQAQLADQPPEPDRQNGNVSQPADVEMPH